MIIFDKFIENQKGIQFSSLESQEIIIKIIDGYTELCSYERKMEVIPNINYYFFHPVDVYHRRFEIWDNLEQNLLLKVDTTNLENINLKNEDKFNKINKFGKTYNIKDSSVGLPLYEIFVTKIYDKFFKIEEGDTVVDIGGNIGLFSYYALCKGASKVYCFEPSPKTCNVIKSNFNFNNLIIEEAAVSSQDGYIDFFEFNSNSIGSSIFSTPHLSTPENVEKITCKSINFNNYIKTNNIEKIDYFKIDCEGAEYEIIESLDEQYLTNNVNKICLEYHFNKNGKINTILDKLKKCNFNVNFEFGDHQINDELGIIYAYKQK